MPKPDSSLILGGTFDLKDATGDQISAEVSTSAPVPISQASVAASQCAKSIYADPARSLAVQMQVTVTQHSSIAGQVELAIYLTGPDDSSSGDAITAATSGGPITTCATTDVNTANYSRFSVEALAPGRTSTYSAWWVLPGAITPANPTGDAAEIGQLTLNPQLGDQQTGGNWTSGTASGPGLEGCTYAKSIGIGSPDRGIRLSSSLPANCTAIASYPLAP